MERIKVAPEYDAKWLEVDRPQPLTDRRLHAEFQNILNGQIDHDISDAVYDNFKAEMTKWLTRSRLNKLKGFDSFKRVDIINGCTQFIDDIYTRCSPMIVKGDYRYHDRLDLGLRYTSPGYLFEKRNMIMAMPFPSLGAPHPKMVDILDECLDKQIALHIDGAWISCCRDIEFDFSHPAIHSVGISLSKGLGLGWNRIGLRWTRSEKPDTISIMNDFHMNNRALSMIGLHFLKVFPSDYLWNKHGDNYKRICDEFKLTPTNAIHIALKDDQPVGLTPLLRYLDERL